MKHFVRKVLPALCLSLFPLYGMAQTILFNDNCNTITNWTNTGAIYPAGTTNPTYNWYSVDPVIPTDDHTGGGNCLYMNGNSLYIEAQAGNYILYQIKSAAPINLTGWNNTRLEFWMQMRSETGNWDGGYIEWSHNGTTWTQLTTELCVPYDGNISQNPQAGPYYPYMKPAWFNFKTTWTRVLVNLSTIDNVPSFYLRYTFLSDELAHDQGWAIDDIKIVSVATIQLQGNSLVIPGGNVPSAANNTDFGSCSVGQFIDKEFFIHNTGESPLTLTGTPYVTTTGAGFSVLTQPATNIIPPGGSVPFTIRFQPGAVGNVNGTVIIPHSDIYSACTVVNPFTYNIKGLALNTPPQISNLADTSVCPGAGPITIDFNVNDFEQNPNVITLTGSSDNIAAIPNANITFAGTGTDRQVTFTALPGQTGLVTITVTANDGQTVNNTSSATFTVNLDDTVPPMALCQDVTVQLDVNGAGSITPDQVDFGSTDNCLLGPKSVSQSQFSCADVGVQNLIFEIADALGNTAQCPFLATVLPPAGTLTLNAPEFIGGNEVSCMGASDGTINALAQGGCGPYTYTWTEIPGLTDVQATNLAAGTYHVQATDAAGQVWDAEIILTEPTALNNLSTSQDASCFEKADGQISLNVDGGNGPYTYSAGPQISGLPAGTYNYTAEDANGCDISMSFTIHEPTQIVLNVSPSVTVQCGEEVPLVAEAFNGTGSFAYNWSGPGVTCANCAITFAIASESSVYDITATDENGCSINGQLVSEVNCNVYIPNAFTPTNGDDLNPNFLVYTGLMEQFSFTIYDRWGQLMFRSDNPDMGWDGSYGKKMAPQGVYVYKLTYRFPKGKETVLIGNVTLLSGN